MVRTTQNQANAKQWMTAWVALPVAVRVQIIEFCLTSDVDVADTALMIPLSRHGF